jgi:ADP-heptose:LPS heptosyltransferase
VRYAELVKQQGATVIVECKPPLARLFASCPGVDRVMTRGEPLPRFDVWTTLLSLPGIFETSLATIPAKVPYLWPSEALVEQWKDELSKEKAFKIGIAWQGNPTQLSDRFRSLPLAHFAGIAATRGVRLYSLQMGAGREQLADRANALPITDLADRLGDFHNTAAIIRNLDLVITCDSSPAHLAGALGVPVWVALAFAPDWRWMLKRPDSPWYPTMRLFRQQSSGDWDGVFESIRDELTRIV